MKKSENETAAPAQALQSNRAERSLTLRSGREQHQSALRPTSRQGVCVVMACSDNSEADQVGRCLSELNTGCLVSYLKAEDLLANGPAGPVALVILATRDPAETVRRSLRWLKNRWPHCPVTVVGDGGSGEYEMAAREGGAIYLTRPVRVEEWRAILCHAVQAAARRQARLEGAGQYAPETARQSG